MLSEDKSVPVLGALADSVDWPIDGYDKEPDSDPMDQMGHGTHVAGIVAGKSDQYVVDLASS